MASYLDEVNVEEDTQKGKFLTFALGKEVYGIEISNVTEIIGIQQITDVPEVPVYVKGIINLRGKIIPVVDLRLKFKREPLEYDDRTCVIVIDIGNISVGLIVDTVADVVPINDENLVPPPSVKTGFHNKFIKGIGKVGAGVILILDCEKLFSEDDVSTMEIIS